MKEQGEFWMVQIVDYGCDSVYPLQAIASLQHLWINIELVWKCLCSVDWCHCTV